MDVPSLGARLALSMHQLAPLDALHLFVRVAQARSFTRAAKELPLTRSALSHRIIDLERQLGVHLFERTTRSVQLTETGRALYEGIAPALEQVHESLARLHSKGLARLTISCSPSFALRCLLPHLSEFRALYPELEVHTLADDRLVDPRREDIDLCIRYGTGHYPGLTVSPLTREWVFPVCAPEFMRRHRLRAPAQLEKLPLIHHDVLSDHPKRVDWPRWFARAGLDPKAAVRGTHYSHAHMALSAALGGEGVALARTSLVRDDLTRGLLAVPFGPKVRSELGYYLVTSGAPGAQVRLFSDWLRKLVLAPKRSRPT